MKRVGFALFLISLLATGSLLSGTGPAPLVRALVNQKVAVGCGCSFTVVRSGSSEAQATVFFAALNGPAWVNIQGSDVKLAAIVPAPACCLQKVGDKVSMLYRGAGAEVNVTSEVTWACPTDSGGESCELFRLRGKLTAKTSAGHQTLEVAGECGC